MSPAPRLTPGRIALLTVAAIIALIALFYLFQLLEHLLPSNY